jgi:hypothetical protein
MSGRMAAGAEKAAKEGLSADPYELLGIDKLATDDEATLPRNFSYNYLIPYTIIG